MKSNTQQLSATYWNTLQHTATHYKTLQHSATHCNKLLHTATQCYTLQHIATHCYILLHTATHCKALQHTAISDPRHVHTNEGALLRKEAHIIVHQMRKMPCMMFIYLSLPPCWLPFSLSLTHTIVNPKSI